MFLLILRSLLIVLLILDEQSAKHPAKFSANLPIVTTSEARHHDLLIVLLTVLLIVKLTVCLLIVHLLIVHVLLIVLWRCRRVLAMNFSCAIANIDKKFAPAGQISDVPGS